MCSAQQLIWQARELASLETDDACLAHCAWRAFLEGTVQST